MASGIGSRGGCLGQPPDCGCGRGRGRRGRSGGRGQSQPPPSPSPSSSPSPMAIDLFGFKFGVNWDSLRLPQRFASIVDGQEPHHVLMRVSGGATGLWSTEVMFDGEGHMFLHNSWRRFACAHASKVGRFVVFKYETMCRRHYHSNEDD